MQLMIRYSEVTIVEVVSEPSVFQKLQRHTLVTIYHMEVYLHGTALKYTHYMTSYVWMKSILQIKSHQE